MPILTPEERLGSALAGKYRLDAIIGRGGAGVLYRATHRWTGREVAVKMLHSSATGEVSKTGRLLSEARAAAGLKHPNVVEVLDADMEDGTPFVVLELLSGRSLGEELKLCERLDPELALRWLLPIIGAVANAHERGILHRDIKLDNIFLAQDPSGALRVKLLDFGLARPVDNNSYMTESGMIVGTPAFMSPEQARAEGKIGPPADVWALGVVLFTVLSGKLPFEAESTTGVLVKIVTSAAPRLSDVAPHVPYNLAHAVDRALQRDLRLRYANPRAFARALASAAVRDGIALPATPDPIGLPEWQNWINEEQNPLATTSLEVPATTLNSEARAVSDDTVAPPRRLQSKSVVLAAIGFAAAVALLGLWAVKRSPEPETLRPLNGSAVAPEAHTAPTQEALKAVRPPATPATPEPQAVQTVATPPSVLPAPPKLHARPRAPKPAPSAPPKPTSSGDPMQILEHYDPSR
jgi:serine/threonine-protein kinase